MTDLVTAPCRAAQPHAIAENLHTLARAMIRQARMLKDAGAAADAIALAGRARALNQLGWSYQSAA